MQLHTVQSPMHSTGHSSGTSTQPPVSIAPSMAQRGAEYVRVRTPWLPQVTEQAAQSLHWPATQPKVVILVVVVVSGDFFLVESRTPDDVVVIGGTSESPTCGTVVVVDVVMTSAVVTSATVDSTVD